MIRIGVDVGGTFTDFTILDEESFAVRYHKVASTPADPSQAIRDGIAEVLDSLALRPRDVAFVGHGTTVATNLVIERRGAVTGLVTTRGFRDILEIGRQTRPHLFDYTIRKPEPLVRRALRVPVTERLDAKGDVVTPLDQADLERAVRALAAGGVESIAICFLHAYRNPVHEEAARAAVLRHLPDAYVSVSSEILPEFREYERLSTTVLNAYAGPRMQRYLDRLAEGIAALGIPVPPYTVHSNGGLMSIPTVRRFPVRTCLSGPAAGVVGAAAISAASGVPDLITFDVGGTSTDVSLIRGGKPLFASSRLVADHPIRTPMVDIHVIGAGGGSIAWIDDAGGLKVGPRSAGAVPGPVAYDKGGTHVTVTDVNIALRRLDPVALLQGRLPVDARKAEAAIDVEIARPLGLDLEAAADGVLRVVNANMSRAIRAVSTERGYDLARFALFAYGGAGPLHACDVAAECGIPRVVVPQEPGTLCARGILLSDLTLDFVRTKIAEATGDAWLDVVAKLADMEREGCAWLDGEGIAPAGRAFHATIDARYVGQNHEVAVDVDDRGAGGLPAFLAAFAEAHAREYGYAIPGRAVEIVNCRLQAIGRVPRPPLDRIAVDPSAAVPAPRARRRVHFGVHGWIDTPVHDRAALPAGPVVHGPAIVEEMSSTIVIRPGDRAHVDDIGNVVIEVSDG